MAHREESGKIKSHGPAASETEIIDIHMPTSIFLSQDLCF